MINEKKSCEVTLSEEEKRKLFEKDLVIHSKRILTAEERAVEDEKNQKLNRRMAVHNAIQHQKAMFNEARVEELEYSNVAMLGTIQELRQRNKELEEQIRLLQVELNLIKN